jgi:glycerol kinase
MQLQSDISGIKVSRLANAEATAAGAAFLAGLAVGFYRDRAEIREKLNTGRAFCPEIDEENRQKLLDGWHRAVRACRAFCES